MGWKEAAVSALMVISATGQAWAAGAMAVTKQGSNTFTHTGAMSKEEAANKAIEACENRYGRECELFASVTGPAALVLAAGAEGLRVSTDKDPLVAAKEALDGCRAKYSGCRLVYAVWEPGGYGWAAAARSASGFLYTTTNFSTRSDAESRALVGCREKVSDPDSCVLVEGAVGQGEIYFARASGKDSGYFSAERSLDLAKKNALKGCGQADCKITQVDVNPASTPAPAAFKKVEAQIKASQADSAKPQKAPNRSTVSTTTQRNVLRCSNDCVNGACVRTFEDGRKERWQAPRRYNPLTQNWEWDINTNACGG